MSSYDQWPSYNSCTGQSATFTFSYFRVNQIYGDPYFHDAPPGAFSIKVNAGDVLNFDFNGTYKATPVFPSGGFDDFIRDYGGQIYMMGTVPDYLCWEELLWSNAPADVANLYLKYDKGYSILLGETKYYYATEDNGQLTIHETKDPTSNPGISSIVFDNPTAASSSEKNPIYWEYEYPVYNGNIFTGMSPLPKGMIRLIGRYWEAGKTFETTLTAHNTKDGKIASIDIEVKKPTKLGSNYSKAKDVFGNNINIDSLCITYSGHYGIPPQLIKGQMEQEAATYNFGGNVGVGFAPSYRYEPYTVQFWSWIKNRTRNPFYITLSNVDNPPIPDHKYVQKISYIYPNKYVWDVIYDHSQLINNNADDSHKLYGVRTHADTMNFLPYKKIQRYYSTFLKKELQKYKLSYAAKKANAQMVIFLRDKWHGGTKKILAQTRIASSYGLLQMLYSTAIYRGFIEDISHLPEDLNTTSTILNLSIQYQKSLLVNNIGSSVESVGNWPDGFEESLYKFVYGKWNPRSAYKTEVFQKSRNFIPQP